MLNMIHYDIDGVDFEPGIKYHNIDRIDFGKKKYNFNYFRVWDEIVNHS